MRSPVTRASLVVALEGAVLLLLGLGYGAAGLLGDPFDRTATLLEAAFAMLVGGLLLLVARGLARVDGWSRSPAAPRWPRAAPDRRVARRCRSMPPICARS